MSAISHGAAGSPSNPQNDAVREDPTAPSTSSDARLGLGSTAEEARVSLDDDSKPVETRFSDYDINESRVSKLENVDTGIGGASGGALENQPSSSISRGGNDDLDKTDLGNVKSEHKTVKNSVDDYDSILSEFDQFAAKGVGEAVGYGYEIGDMVWGKVKSHPMWPGQIYNEALASPSVQRSKREGHVLVAFFGDSSYGWFDPAELVPFEENFAEKSRQTSSRGFVKAVEESVDELSRRRSLGLACRCRNEFNFWPSSVKGYFVVDVGDYEPVVYSTSQINKAREAFHPNEMLSFVRQLALTPMTNQHGTIEFIKNKATALACRKALFEEFDETYAQAFGTEPERPSRPTAPAAVDPSKAPLSGRQVFAEAVGKGKLSTKPTKSKDQVEKDKYLFKRRDEPVHVRAKKTGQGHFSGPARPLLIDGSGLSGMPSDSAIKGHMHQSSVSDMNDGQHQPINQASVVDDIKPSESSKKLFEGGMKKAKLQKLRAGGLSAENATLVAKKKRKKEIPTERPAGELSAENAILVEKKKKKRRKEIRSEATADVVKLPLADNSNSGAAVDKVSGIKLDVPLSDANNQLDNLKNDDLVAPSSSPESKETVDLQRVELPMLVKDLCALAVDPFHGVERSCQATTRLVILKYRSLVYQKSLASAPSSELEISETNSSKIHSTASGGPADKSNEKSTIKLTKSLVRPDDPTKSGKKRGPSDRPEAIKKKKKLNDSEDINKRKKLEDINKRKKVLESEDIKKKKKIIDDSKLLSVEKKIPQRSTESQQGAVKEVPARNAFPTLPKVVKVESSKRMGQPGRVSSPTMLVLKFPAGAALPSGAELRAKFARFGPVDQAATRVFWKTYTCRLVFQQKVHAEAALKFARESGNLFGSTNVRSYTREVGGDAVESEPVRVQKEDPSAEAPVSRESVVEQRTGAKITVQVQPVQQSAQLKSCLKKPSSEEVGNGNGRGTRVKFVLGGEGNTNTEQLLSSYHEGASSYTHSSMDITSKNLPKFIPHSSVAPSPTHHQFQKFPINMPSVELPPRSFNATPTQQIPGAPKNDISQQFLNLLTRCSDVVNNLTGILGYVPYHPL